jgi:hypothetical protein
MLKNILKKIVGTVAPNIGQALGGPLGGMAMGVVAKALGCKPDQNSIESAIQVATPEQLLELKKAEKEFEVKMKELDVDLFELATADIQDARKNFSGDWTAKFLGIMCLMGFFGYIFLVTIVPPNDMSDDIVMLILGYMSGIASAVVSFYFGASNIPDKKD